MNAFKRWGCFFAITGAGLAWSGAATAQEEPDALHPPKLTVNLKDTSLANLAMTLNSQLGGDYVRTDGGRRGAVGPANLTINAKDQTLWEILRQVHLQSPQAFSIPWEGVDNRTGNITLGPPSGRTPPQQVYVTDGVCAVPLPQGDPATGNWVLRCRLYTDPRVRMTYNMTALRVEKALDQDGRALEPLPTLSGWDRNGLMPGPMVSCTATFAAAPGLKSIKELTGSVAVEVVEKTQTVKIDVQKELKEPTESAIGKFSVQKVNDNGLIVTLERPAGAEPAKEPGATSRSAGKVLVIHTIDTNGGVLDMSGPDNAKSWNLQPSSKTRIPASLEIEVCLKSRETTLPVVFKDLPIPENPVTPPRLR